MLGNYNDETIKALLEKYAVLLEFVDKSKTQKFVVVIDTSINYIVNNLQHLDNDWKAFIMVVVKEMFIINNNLIVSETIADFIEYKNKHYEAFINDIAISTDEYYLRSAFIILYLREKKSS